MDFCWRKTNSMPVWTDVEAETPILWPPDAKSWLIWKDPNAGKDWGQEEKRTTEDEMVGWHHRLDGHGFGWTPGAGNEQGGLACCCSWGHKESDTTEWLNWTDKSGKWAMELEQVKCSLVLSRFSCFSGINAPQIIASLVSISRALENVSFNMFYQCFHWFYGESYFQRFLYQHGEVLLPC